MNRYRFSLFLLLTLLLTSINLLIYSGRIESGDSLRVFDAVSSIYRFDDVSQDESMWFAIPVIIEPEMEYPLRPLDVDEPTVVYLSLPLYWLADKIPSVGFVHMVWLLNSFMMALASGILYWMALLYGYDEKVACLAAVLMAVGTIVLPYSRTLFRDPLAMFFLAMTIFWLEYWRSNRYWMTWCGWLGFVLWVLSLLILLQTKHSAMLAIPILGILMLPHIQRVASQKWWKRLTDFALLFIILSIPVLVFVDAIFEPIATWIHPLLRRIDGGAISDSYSAQTSMYAYLFSIGGSIWGTSPIILLAVPGLWLWYRQEKRRIVWAVVIGVIGYAAGHAFITREYWFGGLSWPPRFLIPIIPLLMIGMLPVLDRLLTLKRDIWLKLVFIVLLIYSLWIQFNAIAIEWSHYTTLIPEESGGAIEWIGGLTRIEYLRWVIQPSLWDDIGFDFIWTRANQPIWVASYVILILIASGLVYWFWHKRETRYVLILPVILWFVLIATTVFNLQSIYYKDSVYWSNTPALHDVIDTLHQESYPNDVLILPDNTYERFILNHNDLNNVRVITLSLFQPGENPSDVQSADVTSVHPVELLNESSIRIIDHVASKRERLWVLANNGPFIPWAVRPVEQYLTRFYYPIRDVTLATPDPTVRLIEFATTPAPNPYGFVSPQHQSDLHYDESIRLSGYDLPLGDMYSTGDIVPLSLSWQTDEELNQDYVVAWFIANDGYIHQAQDTQPAFGFMPTSSWQVDVPVWDNHAVTLPSEMPPGDYNIWVVLYRFTASGEIERLPVVGEQTLDGTIGILPTTLHIQP